jgi:heme/copper-type cytochrome/quinol oxidase subunit 1
VHSLVRLYIKTAIVFLLAGLAIGGWMIAERDLLHRFPSGYATSAHTHAILVGFVMMMILGVALWLFPRPDKQDQRYKPGLVLAAYWLLTVGTAVRVLGELAEATGASPQNADASLPLRVAVVSAGFAQIAGLVLFFLTMWSRIRALGSAARERAGERF